MMYTTRPRQEGIALLTATIFMLIAVLVLSALSLRAVNQNRQVNQYVRFSQCFQGLEAGLGQARGDLESGGQGQIGLGSWSPAGLSNEDGPILPSFDDDAVSPLSIPSMPRVQYMAYTLDWGGDGWDNNGDGMADDPSEAGMSTVYMYARHDGVVRRGEAVMNGSNVNVWTNAVFAGSGHASGTIQGNCSIHGSVHILGDHILPGGEAIVVLDMMGASLIHNNYGEGPGPGPVLSPRLRASVPPQPQTVVNGEVVDTLNAALRVKRGLVSLNSSSEVGQADVAGNTIKETMDAVYSNDGWTGSRVVDDGGKGDPTVVFSDNGWDHDYDLGDQVPMPLLDDDWRWPGSFNEYELGYPYSPAPGSTEPSPDGDPYVHTEFFSDVLSDGAAYEGNVAIDVTSDFYLNLTRPSDPDPANRIQPDPGAGTSGDDYLYYDSGSGVLEINGQIEINGNLEITTSRRGASAPSIYYTGRAAILAHGDVTLNTDLFACNNGDPNDYVNSFPANNCFGIMAEGDMTLGEYAQIDMMGAFYAQGQIDSSKQTVVMGTFVANYFDMGNQVPDIYQVPALADNLPLGMIGNWPIWVFSQVSWRELGV